MIVNGDSGEERRQNGLLPCEAAGPLGAAPAVTRSGSSTATCSGRPATPQGGSCPVQGHCSGSHAPPSQLPSPVTDAASIQLQSQLLNMRLLPREPSGASSAASSQTPSTAGAKPPLHWLVGTWKGKGKGIYPTIRDFEYSEEVCFEWDSTNSRPILFYRQKSWSIVGHPPKPMHMESGWVRVITPPGSSYSIIECLISAPNGVSEVEEGIVEGNTIRLHSTHVMRTATSRDPHAIKVARTYSVDPTKTPQTLHYTMDMATSTHPTLTRHLEALLTKWDDEDGDNSEPL